MKNIETKIEHWVKLHYSNLAIYNGLLVLLVLLHTARYFDPFWLISINVIVLIALVASIFLLGSRSRVFFIITLIFWIFAGLLKLARIDVWAERTAVYAFESLILATILLFIGKD